MAAKFVLAIAAQVLLIQVAFGQTVQGPYSYAANNVVNDNDVYYANNLALNLGGVSGSGSAVGFGGSALGLGGSAIGLGGSAIGLGGLGYGAVNAVPALISSATLAPFGAYNIIPSGPLAVNTVSPIGPSGLAVASENYLEAVLGVSGQLPWLSAVAFEGAVPTAGSGVTTCGCGNGQVGITSQGLGPVASPFPFPGYGVGGGNIYY